MNPKFIGTDEILGAAHLKLDNLPLDYMTEYELPMYLN